MTFNFLVLNILFRDDFSTFSGDQRFVDTISSPVDDQGFSNTEEHDSDLGDRKEAPDRSLFHEIGSDQAGQIWAESKEKDSLNNHSFLFIESKEGSEHKEWMDSSSGNNVSGVSHWDRPSEMVVSSVCAKLLASQPLGRGANKSLIPNIRDKEASEQHSSSDKTESLDDHVAIEVFLVFGKRSVDDVAEIWLKTDMKETQNG